MSFCFGFRPPEAASTLRYFKCSAEVNSACAEVLPSKTLVRRKGAAGQKAGWVVFLYLFEILKY